MCVYIATIDNAYEHQILTCQCEPQLVFVAHIKDLDNVSALQWKSLGYVELNMASSNDTSNDGSMEWTDNNALKLQKLSKEMDLDIITTHYNKLMTGLTEVLTEMDNKHIYVRVRVRKLVKFKDESVSEDEDMAPNWIEAHFSTPVRLFIGNNKGTHSGPLPSLSDLSMTQCLEEYEYSKYDKVARQRTLSTVWKSTAMAGNQQRIGINPVNFGQSLYGYFID